MIAKAEIQHRLERALRMAKLNLRAIQKPPPDSRLVDYEEAWAIFERAMRQEFEQPGVFDETQT